MPLQLVGTRQILEYMDWGSDGAMACRDTTDFGVYGLGSDGAMGKFINIGALGGKEVDEVDDIFILVAPQNVMGNYIIDFSSWIMQDLRAMTDVAGSILGSRNTISNYGCFKLLTRVQGLDITALYNPEVYCKPRVNEDVMWLRNWLIENILDVSDKVNVCIFVDEGLVVIVCGASLEYTNDGEMEQEENFEYNTTSKDVII
ncbi:adenylate kinase [Tanacetum coccineum]